MAILRDEIAELESIIDHAEDVDPTYINPHIRQLRHRVFYIHSAIENGLEVLIAKFIIPDLPNAKSFDEGENNLVKRIRLYELLQQTGFYRKIVFLAEKKLVDNKILTTFKEVNTIRNEFAHPDPYKIKRFTDDKLTAEILRKLVKGLEKLQALFKSQPITP